MVFKIAILNVIFRYVCIYIDISTSLTFYKFFVFYIHVCTLRTHTGKVVSVLDRSPQFIGNHELNFNNIFACAVGYESMIYTIEYNDLSSHPFPTLGNL